MRYPPVDDPEVWADEQLDPLAEFWRIARLCRERYGLGIESATKWASLAGESRSVTTVRKRAKAEQWTVGDADAAPLPVRQRQTEPARFARLEAITEERADITAAMRDRFDQLDNIVADALDTARSLGPAFVVSADAVLALQRLMSAYVGIGATLERFTREQAATVMLIAGNGDGTELPVAITDRVALVQSFADRIRPHIIDVTSTEGEAA